MTQEEILDSVPLTCLITVTEDKNRLHYIEAALNTPQTISRMLSSPKTGAYIRGLIKTHDLPENTAPLVAFVVLRIAIGELRLNTIKETLVSELNTSPEQAQKIAVELERDLFAPIAQELNQSLALSSQSPATRSPHPSGARNVLDLKQQKKIPAPPPLPRPTNMPPLPRPPKPPLSRG